MFTRLAWREPASIHWAAPCLAGLLFGFGYVLAMASLHQHDGRLSDRLLIQFSYAYQYTVTTFTALIMGHQFWQQAHLCAWRCLEPSCYSQLP
jgi:hypothetical protein